MSTCPRPRGPVDQAICRTVADHDHRRGLVLILALLGAEVYSSVVDDEGLANLDIPALEYSKPCGTPDSIGFVTGFTNVGGGIGMPILASILTAWLTIPEPDLASHRPGGRCSAGFHTRHHVGKRW
jgi:hypothetical protein